MLKSRQERYFSEKNLLHKHIESALTSRTLAWSRIVLGVLCSLLFFFPVLFLWLVSSRYTAVFLDYFFRWLCWIIGLKIILHGNAGTIAKIREHKKGSPSQGAPKRVYVVNHISYLDILALRACLGVQFIAKKEVRSWAYIGWYAVFCDSIFIARSASKIKDQFQKISNALRDKASLDLLLFPEGTTSSGWQVLPFKTALFDLLPKEVQAGTTIVVQPVSLWYSKIDNVAMTAFERDFIGWVGDEALYPHVIRCLGLGSITLEIFVNEEILVQKSDDRKKLSSFCREKVIEGIDDLREIEKKKAMNKPRR